MYHIRPYKEGDVRRMPNPKFDPLGGGDLVTLEYLAMGSTAFTVLHGGTVLASGGFLYQWKNVYYAWCLISKKTATSIKHTKTVLKAARYLINNTALCMNIRRIEAVVDTSRPENRRWLEGVGFEYEHTRKNAGPEGHDVEGWVFRAKGV
jgi:hypothetical protein